MTRTHPHPPHHRDHLCMGHVKPMLVQWRFLTWVRRGICHVKPMLVFDVKPMLVQRFGLLCLCRFVPLRLFVRTLCSPALFVNLRSFSCLCCLIAKS